MAVPGSEMTRKRAAPPRRQRRRGPTDAARPPRKFYARRPAGTPPRNTAGFTGISHGLAKAADAAALDASILPTMAAAEAERSRSSTPSSSRSPAIDEANINTYAGPPPRTSGRRRKPSVLVHQVSVDEDDGGLYVQPAPRPAYQGGVRLSEFAGETARRQ